MAGLLWIVVGSRLQFVDDSRENDLANLVVYGLGFVIVFFGIGG